MLNELMSVMAAIEAGDKARARRLLRPLLNSPVPRSGMSLRRPLSSPRRKQPVCQRALALDPLHGRARSRLLALQGEMAPPVPPPPTPQPSLEALTQPPLKPKAQRRSQLARPGCLLLGVLSLAAASYFVMSVLGLQIAGRIASVLSGAPRRARVQRRAG